MHLGHIQPKQALFMRADKRHVAFGGARGGGKSWALRTKFKILAAKYAGIKLLLLRRTYSELYENHLKYLIPELNGFAKYNDKNKEFRFPNGSIWTLGYCATDNDYLRYQGAEYDVIGFDEAGQLREDWISKINQSVRGVNDFPKRSYYTLNPGGVSHAYFKRVFIDRKFTNLENPDDYIFIQSKVTDNAALMRSQPDYIRSLQSIQSVKLRKAWLDGDWDIFDGQFFDDFVNDEEHYNDRRYTHVIDPFVIPSSWTLYRSFDWGYARPFSVGWWAVDYDGVLYRILELYGMGEEANTGVKWTSERLFSEVARIEREHEWLRGKRINGVADPAIWGKEGGGISINDVAVAHGVYFNKADNARIPGWMQVRYRLQFDNGGYPRMYFFKNCKAAIRTLPMMQYDDKIPEDLDTELEDHACDDIRYMCMMRPVKPLAEAEPPKFEVFSDPLEQFKDIKSYRGM